MSKLTIKQKKFADEYIISGNIYQSMLSAGYSENYAKSDGCKILENPSVKNYIEERTKEAELPKIASMQEIHEFWANMVRDENARPNDRLKASELIAKTQGAFLDKVEVTGTIEQRPYEELSASDIREYLNAKQKRRA